MMVGTSEGTEVNLLFVVEAVPDGETMLLTLSGGETRKASFREWYAAIALATRQIISAEEGTYILRRSGEPDTRAFHREKVIAWGIDSLLYVRPITVGDAPDELAGEVPPILHPDGTVTDETYIYASVEDWLDAETPPESPADRDECSGPRSIH